MSEGFGPLTPENFTKFDAAEYLKTDEAIAAFIADADTTGDKEHIEQARHVAERARALNKKKRKDHPMSKEFAPLKTAEHVFVSKSKAPKPLR